MNFEHAKNETLLGAELDTNVCLGDKVDGNEFYACLQFEYEHQTSYYVQIRGGSSITSFCNYYVRGS